jgi:hypothetical protein
MGEIGDNRLAHTATRASGREITEQWLHCTRNTHTYADKGI